MNFKFSNLLGAPYRGGNLLVTGENELLTPVGNRVSQVSRHLPCEPPCRPFFLTPLTPPLAQNEDQSH